MTTADSNDHKPPLDFGVRGMAAALEMTEEEFRAACRRGDVGPPDSISDGGPRWTPLQLAAELKKVRPSGVDILQALLRAEQAEGW